MLNIIKNADVSKLNVKHPQKRLYLLVRKLLDKSFVLFNFIFRNG